MILDVMLSSSMRYAAGTRRARARCERSCACVRRARRRDGMRRMIMHRASTGMRTINLDLRSRVSGFVDHHVPGRLLWWFLSRNMFHRPRARAFSSTLPITLVTRSGQQREKEGEDEERKFENAGAAHDYWNLGRG